MSSPRHHYQPRFLLRGFCSRTVGKEHFLWAFRRQAEPFETNVGNVATERHFHGEDEEVERAMADVETQYAVLLTELREGGEILERHLPTVALLLSNLIIRTRNFRLGLAQVMDDAFAVLGGIFSTKEFRDFIHRVLPTEVPKQLNQLMGRPADATIPAQLQEWLTDQITKDDVVPFGQEVIQAVRDHSPPEKTISDAHVKSLRRDVVSEPRASKYSTLIWQLVHAPTGKTYILGDVGAIGVYDENPDHFQSPVVENKKPRLLCLPISTCHMLVGTAGDQPIPSVDMVNRASSELSREHIVAHQNTAHERELQERIGKRCTLFSSDEMRRIFGEVLQGSSLS